MLAPQRRPSFVGSLDALTEAKRPEGPTPVPRRCDEHGSACAFKALYVELQQALLHVDEPAVARSMRGLGSVAEATVAPPPITPTRVDQRQHCITPACSRAAPDAEGTARVVVKPTHRQLGMGEEAGVGPGPRSQAAPRSPAAVREGSTALQPGAANHSVRVALHVAEQARASVARSTVAIYSSCRTRTRR